MEDNAYPVEKTPVSGGGSVEVSGGGGSGELNEVSNMNGSVPSIVMKRKRGRPKKLPVETPPVMYTSSAPQMNFPTQNVLNPSVKRGRGRPKGSFKARFVNATVPPPPGFGEVDVFGYGEELKLHILTIYPGEDVHGRILSFAQSGNRAITVLSCTGPVARVSICSPGSAPGVIYEGLSEILSLNGTFTYGGTEGSYHRRGTLTACLANRNGEVFGGCVSGPIIAAGTIQLILGSFEQGRRPSPTNIQFQSYPAPHMANPTLRSTPQPPPPPAAVQVSISKPNVSFQKSSQDQDTFPPSLMNSDPLSTTYAQVTSIPSNPKDDQVSTPFLQVPPSPQPALNQPLVDTEAQVNENSFADENLVASNAP